MAKTPAGDTLFKVSSEMGITANDLGEMGFKVTAEANMFNDQYKYGFKGHYEPMTEVKSVETTCEMTMKLTLVEKIQKPYRILRFYSFENQHYFYSFF